MKKTAFVIGAAAVAAATAISFSQAQTSVTSANAVGYVRVDLPGGNKLEVIAVPFNRIDPSNQTYTLDELIGTNMTANSDATAADEIYVWDGSKYNIAFLNDDGWGNPAVDWKWCYFKTGEFEPTACATTNIFSVKVGNAFWIRNKGIARQLYLLGEVPSVAATTNSVASGLTMLGNPYPVDRTLDQMISTNDGAHANSDSTAADQILVWDGTNSKYDIAFLNDNGWGNPAVDWKWCYFKTGEFEPTACDTSATFTIMPGQGLWYVNVGGTVVWKEDRPYSWW